MSRPFLLTVLFLLLAVNAWAFGEVRYADRPLNIRAGRSLEAAHVKTLQPGDKVRVDFLEDGWYAVFEENAAERDEAKALGYANARFLLPVGKAATAPAPAPAAPAVAAPVAVEVKAAVVPAVPTVPAPEKTAAQAVPAPAGAPLVLSVKAEIKAAAKATALRKARALNAPAVGSLAPGERVQAAFLQDGWFAVFRLNEKNIIESRALGYVHASELLPETPGVKPLPQVEAASPVAPPVAAVPAPTAAVTGQTQPLSVVPGEAVTTPAPTQAPVKITADRMTYVEKDRKVTFSGNVQAEHEGLRLWAATLSAYFTEAGRNAKDMSDNIERIVADGGVKMKKDKSEGSCRTLTYFVKDGMLRMEGEPVLSDSANTVSGEVIKFYIKDSRSEVLGGQGKRVEAVFHVPEGAKKP